MCSKKYSHGSRLMVMSVVLLVLALQPLLAWPFSFGKAEPAETTYQVQSSQDLSQVQELKGQIQSLKNSEKVKDKLIAEQKEMLDNLSSNLQSSGTRINGAKATAESLLGEIGTLKQVSETKDVAYDALKSDYDALAVDYQAKVVESDGYFQEATKAVEKYNAIPKESMFHLAMGTAAIFRPSDKDLGIEANVGIGYGDAMISMGAIYNIEQGFKLSDLSLDDLSYRVGLQVGF